MLCWPSTIIAAALFAARNPLLILRLRRQRQSTALQRAVQRYVSHRWCRRHHAFLADMRRRIAQIEGRHDPQLLRELLSLRLEFIKLVRDVDRACALRATKRTVLPVDAGDGDLFPVESGMTECYDSQWLRIEAVGQGRMGP